MVYEGSGHIFQNVTCLKSGERAFCPALPLPHSFRNSFHSSTPWGLRMRAVTAGSFARAAGTAAASRDDYEEDVDDRNATKQIFMHKSFVIRIGPKSVALMPAKMNFSSLLEELELAEVEGRAPRLRVGSIRKLTTTAFAEFCRKHGLIEASGWDGFCVFTKPDFLWPRQR